MTTEVAERQRLEEKQKILEFISSCFSATGQREFYNSKQEQIDAVVAMHRPMLQTHRKLYALLLISPVNDYNKQVIVYNLLKNGKAVASDQKMAENELIYQCLDSMPPPRAYRTLAMLAKMRVNNSRTRWIAEKFLGSRRDPAFDAVKYGRLIKRILEHTHIHTESEIFDFLFGKQGIYTNELLANYQAAKTDPEKIYKLPYTIAEGFASMHGIPREEFLGKIKGQMTEGEKLRLQESAKKVGVDVEADWRRFDLVRLFKYLRVIDGLPDGVGQAVRDAAFKVRLPEYIRKGNVSLVLDNSLSATGSQEKKNHLIAVGEALSAVLQAQCENYNEYLVNGERKGILCQVGGDTPLGLAVLKALKDSPTHLVIVSDGYENRPAGLTWQILEAYRKLNGNLRVYHFNPVFAAESEAVRSLGQGIPNVGLRDVRNLSLPMFLMQAKQDVTLALDDFERDLLERKKPVDFINMPNRLLPEVIR